MAKMRHLGCVNHGNDTHRHAVLTSWFLLISHVGFWRGGRGRDGPDRTLRYRMEKTRPELKRQFKRLNREKKKEWLKKWMAEGRDRADLGQQCTT
eukprot:2891834-Pyramimonas_sp.AAC.1